VNSRRQPWAMWFADQAEVGRGVVGSGEGVAAIAGKAVVAVVAVLVGVAGDGRVDGASTAGGDDAGNFPVVEDLAEEYVLAVEGTRFDGKSGHEALALVGDAGSALTIGVVGILHRGGRAGDEGVLTVVDGAGVGVGETEICAARHPAVHGEGCAVVDAASGALEFIDSAELGDGPS